MKTIMEVLGDAAQTVLPVPPKAQMVKIQSRGLTSSLRDIAPALVGAAAGYYFWRKHRVLGLLSGALVATNAMDIIKNADRKRALVRLGIVGAAVAGSLWWKKHPAFGYLGAGVAATAATGPLGLPR